MLESTVLINATEKNERRTRETYDCFLILIFHTFNLKFNVP